MGALRQVRALLGRAFPGRAFLGRAFPGRVPHGDIALALLLWTVMLLTPLVGPGRHPVTIVGALLTGVACGVLALRHRWPFVTLAISVVAAELYLAYSGSHRSAVVVLAAPLIAVYTAAHSSRRSRALVLSGLAVLALGIIHLTIHPGVIPGAENVALAALGGVAMAAGHATRNHRALLAEVQARIAHAEADREAEAQRRVTGERLRIARDLHDALGHHLALINIQSAMAARLVPTDPARAAEALEHVHAASRSALAELSATVSVLRQPGDPEAPLEPPAGAVSLARLVEEFGRSGLSVEFVEDGQLYPLPAPVDLAAYRILQEALTNVVKHAAAAEATVSVAYRPGEVHLTVDNTPPPTPVAGTPACGTGLLGMRERATALGGSVSAGPRPGGGFRVSASLPTGRSR